MSQNIDFSDIEVLIPVMHMRDTTRSHVKGFIHL